MPRRIDSARFLRAYCLPATLHAQNARRGSRAGHRANGAIGVLDRVTVHPGQAAEALDHARELPGFCRGWVAVGGPATHFRRTQVDEEAWISVGLWMPCS